MFNKSSKSNPMKKSLLALALAAGLTSFAGSAKAATLLTTFSYDLPMNLGDSAYFRFTDPSTPIYSSSAPASSNYIYFNGQSPISGQYSYTQIGLNKAYNYNSTSLGVSQFPLTAGSVVSSSTSFFNGYQSSGIAFYGTGNYYTPFKSTAGADTYYGYFQFSSANSGLNTTLQSISISTTANTPVTIVNNVPEPSTYALFGLGALALIVAYRRKVA
jgi:hypothetical protein